MGAREYVLAHLLCLLDDEGAQSLLGRGGGDDEAEPDGEHDTEGNGGGGEPARDPHPGVQAGHPVRPLAAAGQLLVSVELL